MSVIIQNVDHPFVEIPHKELDIPKDFIKVLNFPITMENLKSIEMANVYSTNLSNLGDPVRKLPLIIIPVLRMKMLVMSVEKIRFIVSDKYYKLAIPVGKNQILLIDEEKLRHVFFTAQKLGFVVLPIKYS